MNNFARRVALSALLSSAIFAAQANNTPQTLPFNQNWSTTTQITASDNWSGVPGVEGYLGQDITTSTGVNPQTLTGVSALANDLDAIANQTNPNTNSTGGVAEFDGIANPSIALQGSGTADAPYLLIHLNTTGQSGINVAYTLRDLDGSIDNAVMPVALQYRVGNSGTFTDVPAGFVADATTGPSVATLESPVSAALPAAADNQSLVQVRIITANAVGSDEWVGIDDIVITAGGGGSPVLSIADASSAEGDGPGTTFSGMLLVSLSAPAGPGGVSFNASTADGTATAGEDYVAQESWGGFIAEGDTMMGFVVPVYGDTTQEADETFVINITNVVGAIVGDAQGVGTIVNDDITLTPIHAIQGSGATSPLVGIGVTTRGIVTGRKSNGFFIQTPDADVDSDPATSEGVFVFTSSAPPAEAAVGNLVQVSATVVEFIPAADPGQAPLTELSAPSVSTLSTGNALPTAIALTPTFPDPTGAIDQLERVEGMRATAASFTVVAATGGNTNEPNATGSSNGIFNVVVTGVPRPFREPGIQAPDLPPSGSIPPIPRWDFNPELLTVDSDALGATTLNLSTGATITGLTGPLDFGFRRYTLLADATPAVAAGMAVTAARAPTADEFTVAGYNLERFFDTVNDPGVGEPVLSPTAFANRLNKASLAIRDYLNAPDIIGVVEIENLSTLQAVAAKVNSDAVAAAQPDPQYVAYLQEGNDVGGIDVGFLVKSAEISAGIDRVEVIAVTQHGKATTWIEPDNSSSLLNDRPPLQLDAVVHYADGREFPITVIVVHQRSLNGAEENSASGVRIRAKRQEQAEFLATLIDGMQQDDAQRHITVLGDFNAFEFNDGYVDAMHVVEGIPVPDEETVVPGDGIDLVDPDLFNLAALEDAGQRYSFVFDGNAQSLDHVLVNQVLGADVDSLDLDHARINADFPETNRNDVNSPSRLADHDPAVAYFQVPALRFANLATTASAVASSVSAGGTMTFDASVTNNGPDSAEFVGVGFALDAEVSDLAVSAPDGWTCDAPVVAAGTTTVACNILELANGAPDQAFQLTGTAPASEVDNAINLMVLADAETVDPDETDNNASASVDVVAAAADIQVAISGPTRTATHANYTVTVTNAGPDAVPTATLALDTNIPAGVVAFTGAPAPWACDTPGGTAFRRACHFDSSMPAGKTDTFVISVPRTHDKGSYFILGTASSPVPDPNDVNNVARRRLSMPQL